MDASGIWNNDDPHRRGTIKRLKMNQAVSLMKIMAKHVTSRISKVPDGQYTQTGMETLEELHRVHFLDSNVTNQ